MSALPSARTSRFALTALDFWGLGYVLAAIALATAAAWPLYASPRVLLVGAIGGLVGMLIAVLARTLRWGILAAGGAVIAAYLIVSVPLAIPSALTSLPAVIGGLRDAVLGVVLGWKQILTLDPPLADYQAVLIPFLVVILFGSFAATMLALDTRRRAAWATLAAVLMSVFGIAFGLTATSSPLVLFGVALPAPREWVIGVGVFLLALVWLVGRQRMLRARALRIVAAQNVTRRDTPWQLGARRHLLSAGLLVVALGAGFAVAPAASGWSDRAVLRDAVEPMVVVQQQVSPLSTYRAWFAGDRLDETIVTIDGDAGDLERLRFATLDAYDGEEFHISPETRFTRLPRVAGPGSGRVTLDFRVGEGYEGIWVPTPDGLAQAPTFGGSRAADLADGLHVDADNTAITIAETPDGGVGLVPGDSYEALADAPGEPATLAGVQGGESSIDAETHPALAEWVAMQELPRTGEGFVEAITRLRERGYLSHALFDDEAASGWIAALKSTEGYAFSPSYAGHSTSRIEELFTSLSDQERRAGPEATPEMLVSAVGDDEQFAAAAALLARFWGLESRVVVGARLPAAEEVPGIPACDGSCTGANMTAWIEVRAAGTDGEWITVDVTPQFALLPSTITEGEKLPEHATVPEQPRAESVEPPQAQRDSRDGETPPNSAEAEAVSALFAVLRVVGLSVAAVVLLLLPLIALLIVKRARRRSRRTAPDPETRLVGAWEELVDVYADHDLAMAGAGTRVQSADSTGRMAATRLAGIVDRAVFAPHPPAETDAVEAWNLVDEEDAALRSAAGRWRAMRSRLRLRSFVNRIAPGRTARRSRRSSTLATLTDAGIYQQEEDA